MGRDYWRPLLDFFQNRLIREHTIDPVDAERILVTDSAEEAVSSVTDIAMKRFGLTYGAKIRRHWLLGE
jgi:predicted Rossmann-fold nucleotide-binding protein